MVSVRSGSRTQLSALFSCLFLLTVILWLGPLLTTLPKVSIVEVLLSSLSSVCPRFHHRRVPPISLRETGRAQGPVAHLEVRRLDVGGGLLGHDMYRCDRGTGRGSDLYCPHSRHEDPVAPLAILCARGGDGRVGGRCGHGPVRGTTAVYQRRKVFPALIEEE